MDQNSAFRGGTGGGFVGVGGGGGVVREKEYHYLVGCFPLLSQGVLIQEEMMYAPPPSPISRQKVF